MDDVKGPIRLPPDGRVVKKDKRRRPEVAQMLEVEKELFIRVSPTCKSDYHTYSPGWLTAVSRIDHNGLGLLPWIEDYLWMEHALTLA
jgi:hypothetical protein